MRQAATIALMSIVGIHCAAPTSPAETREDATTEEKPRTESRPQVDPPAENGTPPAEETFLVTSQVEGKDGATYVTGTFSGKIVLGDRKFISRGHDDVFLMRIDADGKVAWSLAIGSDRNERAPNVTLDEGRVKLIALTRGEVDCGAGPMATWDSAMFFYCTFGAEEGESLGGLTMPTGEP